MIFLKKWWRIERILESGDGYVNVTADVTKSEFAHLHIVELFQSRSIRQILVHIFGVDF